MTFDSNPLSLWNSLKLADNAFDKVTLLELILEPPVSPVLIRESDGSVTELPWLWPEGGQ